MGRKKDEQKAINTKSNCSYFSFICGYYSYYKWKVRNKNYYKAIGSDYINCMLEHFHNLQTISVDVVDNQINKVTFPTQPTLQNLETTVPHPLASPSIIAQQVPWGKVFFNKICQIRLYKSVSVILYHCQF